MSHPYESAFAAAAQAADEFHEGLPEREVMASADAIAGLARFHRALPEEPSTDAEVIGELHRWGSPAAVATTGGRFFGFVVGGALPAATGAAWLATAWDQNAGSWILSPVGAELETVAAAWLLDILDLPRSAAVGFVTGSTMGTFSALLAARTALLQRQGWDVATRGLNGAPRLRIVVSEEVHPTNLATLNYAGFGSDDLIRASVDSEGRVRIDSLPALDELTILLLQAGNINSGASDPFEPICAKARAAGAWVHIDGAFGLWARVAPLRQHLVRGAELADSWTIDGHKWLNLPHDSAIYACRDAEAVQKALGTSATYLVDTDGRRRPNLFTPELSRRARGVEFWAALRRLGRVGVADLVERSCAQARAFADGLRSGGYDILNDVVLNQVVFADGDEERTAATLLRIQQSGVMWLGPTTWRGRLAMRLSVSSWATSDNDVRVCIDLMNGLRTP